MGAIINLYLLPPRGAPAAALGVAVRALTEAAFLEFPAQAASPFRPGLRQLVTPQMLDYLVQVQPVELSPVPDAVALEREITRASREPRLIRFARLNPDHPDIRRDFDHYAGVECAVGFYVTPGGHRLRLVEEVAEPFDEEVFGWIHLQGKAAPWEDVVRGSALERALRSAWGEARMVESVWP